MQKTLKKYFVIFTVPTLLAFSFAFVIPFVMGVGGSFDVVAGVTTIKAGQVQLTEKSSITEVINSPDAYSDLKAKGIKRLCDMTYAKRYETESATLLNKE